MDRQIIHRPEERRFYLTEEGVTAYVEYELQGGSFIITHTIVPKPIAGKGIAALLVRTAYTYAEAQSLHCAATCSYAQVWLRRNAPKE